VRRLALVLAAALALGGAATGLLLSRGGGKESPRTTSRRTTTRPSHKPRPSRFSWPVYGFDAARTHAAPPLALRPPFRKLWTVRGDWSLMEFPPVLERGRLFLGTNHGLVLAVQAATGRVLWHRQFSGCVAASPAVGDGVVYVGFMDPPPCTGSAPSFVAALDARTGRSIWRFRAGVVETPLTAQIKANPEWYAAYATKGALGRWARPDELAGAVVYLASDAAAFMTGSVVVLDGGQLAR